MHFKFIENFKLISSGVPRFIKMLGGGGGGAPVLLKKTPQKLMIFF